MTGKKDVSSAFVVEYDFKTLNELANETHAENMVEVLVPFMDRRVMSSDEFAATLMLACASLITAISADGRSASRVSRHLALYLHDATSSMNEGEPDATPAPTVPDIGRA